MRTLNALPDAKVLIRELREFRAQCIDADNAKFGAEEDEHNHLMLALS